MTRAAFVPKELTRGPFTLEQARRAGIDLWHLRRRTWCRLGPQVYVWAGLKEEPLVRLRAAQLRVPKSGVFSGLTAGWLHDLGCDPCDPIEVTLPPGAGIAGRAGIRVRRAVLPKKDVVTAKGFRATAIERTLADLSAALTVTETVVLADAACHARLTNRSKLAAKAEAASGRPGVENLRRVLELVEPASESPMETRLRMLLVLSGLPHPVAQHPAHDRWGEFLGRLDLYYPQAKLGIEYDGATHKVSLADDNRRQNRLLQSGIRLLRFTAGDIYKRPDAVVAEVRALLAC